jgi:RNA polymerase sigma factor (sigma-70 family)
MQADTLGLQARTMSSHPPADFDSFYRTHHRDAVRWATALVGSREVGEELAQDALIAVGQKLANIDEPSAYLRRTVVNRAASWHRWHGRSLRRESRATAVQALVYSEPTHDMLDALAVLPYKQRAAVTLRYWADWTDEQIAESLDCAPASVRVLLHRGIAALKKEIAE